MMKKWILPVLMCYSVTLFSQVPYFNIQINSAENLWDGGTYGLIEKDSFYYLSGVTGSPFAEHCDTGFLLKINKFSLNIETIKGIDRPGSKMYGVFDLNNETDLVVYGSSYECHQDIENDDFFLAKIKNDTIDALETSFFGQPGWGEYLNYGILDNESNYVLTGRTFPADNSTRQSILVFKADSNFNEVFNRRYPSASPQDNHFGNDIVATPDGGYIIVGNHRLDIYEDAALIFKIDSLGNTEWWQEFNPDYELDEENLYFRGIQLGRNEEYIVIGRKRINPSILSTNPNVAIDTGVNKERNAIRFFPNPTNGAMQLDIPTHLDELLSIKLHNIYGQCVQSIDVNNTGKLQVNIENLSTGIYMMTIYKGDEVLFSQKIVRN